MPKMPHIVPKKWVRGAALRRGALPCSLRCCSDVQPVVCMDRAKR